jgi:Ring finger domain
MVTCVYPGCGKQCEAFLFPLHATRRHGNAPTHQFTCPVCTLADPDAAASYAVTTNTNLQQHISNAHADMLQNDPGMAEPAPVFGGGGPPRDHDPFDPSVYSGDYDDDAAVAALIEATKHDATPGAADGDGDFPPIESLGLTDSVDIDLDALKGSVVGSGQFMEQTIKESGDPLLGRECEICFMEFEAEDTYARLECFCVFHKDCITSWFKKSNNQCPTHKD